MINGKTQGSARILVVDDDPGLLRLMQLRLEAAGYGVTAVDSGERALAQLAVSRPQVVVTDLQMGGMDGIALFEAIRSENPALPVIILTAHGTIPDAVAAMKANTLRRELCFARRVLRILFLLQLARLCRTARVTRDTPDRPADPVQLSPPRRRQSRRRRSRRRRLPRRRPPRPRRRVVRDSPEKTAARA
jgi:CheY-like chemotaxis protein